MIYVCKGPDRFIQDPATKKVYSYGRTPCGKSLDEVIAAATDGLPPGDHELELVCPCPEKKRISIVHCVEGTPELEVIDFSQLKEADPVMVDRALVIEAIRKR